MPPRRVALLLGALVLATAMIGLPMSRAAAAPGAGSSSEEVDQGHVGPGLARHPLFIKIRGRDARGNPLVTNATPTGYTPSQIAAYLGLSTGGAGQTIAIVAAYDDPNVISDLNTFSNNFALPLTCGSAGANPSDCLTFTEAMPQGTPTTDAGWALEISLDVQWAHAVAPQAAILLVDAASNSDTDLLGGIDYAAGHGASVISNSWGEPEFRTETLSDGHCNLSSAVCTFASGDGGNPGEWPAYDPYVIAVGGTTLTLGSNGSVSSEVAYSDSGGGVSQYEARPSYQNGFNSYANRGMPDVSYDADPSTGFAVYDSTTYQSQSGWFQVGGTSAGAPQWAAIIAVADQLRANVGEGPLNAASFGADATLYGVGSPSIADITSGSNGTCGSICTAQTGYDFVTGLGSPRPGIGPALAGVSLSVGGEAVAVNPASLPRRPGNHAQALLIAVAAAAAVAVVAGGGVGAHWRRRRPSRR